MTSSDLTTSDTQTPIYRKNYLPPDFIIEQTDLKFQLFEAHTLVTSTLKMMRNPRAANAEVALVLNGRDLELRSISLDGQLLKDSAYQVMAEELTVFHLGHSFTLTIVTQINPQTNTTLEGLYASNGMYCTQCEAEGFRKITYYLDRPDVMSCFTTRIEADKAQFPVLLSNGNKVDSGDLPEGRHWVQWVDPFKKPCYLFALVAGDLVCKRDSFITHSKREVALEIYVEAQDLDKVDFGLSALKKSMRWDEEVFGREYDLDIFMIVAVSHFNMGAMENKGLNIFNTSCVLANPLTTTDAGFERVEAVIAHEYFHNWSGNRVTCRSWFELSLKEGFTVFRDQEFSADVRSRAIKRVEDVSVLRSYQFPEDSGPMAHPIRPDDYIEINNFYTVTVYEKGAEVVRMLHTLLGAKAFRKGSDLYFDRHDGEAVTCDDFVKAMEDASGLDLTQFYRWYSQAGIPEITLQESYDATAETLTVTLTQLTPATPGQELKQALLIPVKIALFDRRFGHEGQPVPLFLEGGSVGRETVLSFTEFTQSFVFEQVKAAPLVSIFRDFSAPIKLVTPRSNQVLEQLVKYDDDAFSRWDAMDSLKLNALLAAADAVTKGGAPVFEPEFIELFGRILTQKFSDSAEKAQLLQLPTISYLAQQQAVITIPALVAARNALRIKVASLYRESFLSLYHSNTLSEVYEPSTSQIAARQLKNMALSYLAVVQDEELVALCNEQFEKADNMTDQSAALRALVHEQMPGFEDKLSAFYEQWKHEALVVNLWISIQATAPKGPVLEQVKALEVSSVFDWGSPNQVRALVGGFTNANPANFHAKDGLGYAWLEAAILRLNTDNPQIAARLVTPLTRWRQYEASCAALMKGALERLSAQPLSKNVYEIVMKSLEV